MPPDSFALSMITSVPPPRCDASSLLTCTPKDVVLRMLIWPYPDRTRILPLPVLTILPSSWTLPPATVTSRTSKLCVAVLNQTLKSPPVAADVWLSLKVPPKPWFIFVRTSSAAVESRLSV